MGRIARFSGHRRRVGFRSGLLEVLEPRVLCADGISPAPGPPIHSVVGVPISNAVFATYTVTDPTGAPGDQWRGLVNFGDGQVDGPLIPIAKGAGFEFVDTHTYRLPGTYTVTIMIALPGSHMPNDNTVTTTVTVAAATGSLTPTPTAPPPTLAVTGRTLKAREGRTFHGSVAIIHEARAVSRGFTATIDWGDLSPATAAQISARGSGRFAVIGSHRYLAPGMYAVGAAIRDASGRQVFAMSRIHVVQDRPLHRTSRRAPGRGQHRMSEVKQ
jgi:hypothetical protein